MLDLLYLAAPSFSEVKKLLDAIFASTPYIDFRHVYDVSDETLNQCLIARMENPYKVQLIIASEDCYLDNGRPIIIQCRAGSNLKLSHMVAKFIFDIFGKYGIQSEIRQIDNAFAVAVKL